MDRDERQNDRIMSIDKDAQINVVVNNPNSDDGEIDLSRVLHNANLKRRIYAWVLLLCLAVGISGSLLVFQLTREPTTVSAVVTLGYEIPNPILDPEKNPEYDPSLLLDEEIPLTLPVEDLTAPDGTDLDLNQITSSFVLQTALTGLELSHPITLANLRDNIRVDKILTEDSRRQQEVAASMIEDKDNAAYTQVQEIELTYDNQFIVSLTNGFGDEDSRIKYDLTDSELRLILDRILDAYNVYMVNTYADNKLPDDEITVIDTENLDILESLDLLRTAVRNLYDYCDEKSDTIKNYRSWRTGRSLNDLMENLERARNVNVDYLYSYVYTNSIVKNRKSMITNYQYQLRNAQSELEVVNENIATTQTILDNYKNDEIFVSMQESDTAKSTQTTTDYYNKLILQQSENYDKAAELETTITDLQDKINSLNANTELASTEQASEELANAIEVCHNAYSQIKKQMEEIMGSAFYTTYADHSVAQGKTESFITASLKKVIIGAVAGIVIACGLWFLSALIPELRTKKPEDAKGKEAAER